MGVPIRFVEQNLLARLFDFDDARKGFIRLSYWRDWKRDQIAHTRRALAAFDRAAEQFDLLECEA
jgi:hypothetical protein